MAIERITVNGQEVTTLKELLRPGLKAVFIGLNPGNKSVMKAHYYQGRRGRRFWKRLRECGIVPALADGTEDDAAITRGYGFADLVRRPARSGKDLSKEEKSAAVPDLRACLSRMGDRPTVVFVYQEARKLAGPDLEKMGYRVLKMPGPYAKKEDVCHGMEELKAVLNTNARVKAATDNGLRTTDF